MGMADDMRNLAEGIGSSYDTRIAAIAGIEKETERLLKDFRSAHKDMADTLRDTLEKGEKVRLAEFKPMMQGISDRVGEIKDDTEKLLIEGEDNRLKAFRDMDKDIKASVARIEKETKHLLNEYATANEAMAKEWSNLSILMEKKRTGKVLEAKPKVAKPKAAKRPVEENMEDRILSIVEDRPGVTLKEIADSLGMHFVRISANAKSLVEKGKLRKEKSSYYTEE